MPTTDLIRGKVKQGEPAVFVARIVNVLGVFITQASIATIQVKIFDTNNANALVYGPANVPILTTVFNTLQLNATLWPFDNIGYNFLWVSPQTAFPNYTANQSYRVEFEFTDTGGNKWTVPYRADVEQILSSPLP